MPKHDQSRPQGQKNTIPVSQTTDTVLRRAFENWTSLLITLSHHANRLASWWLIMALGLMSILIGTQVFCRYILNNSLFWSEEVGRILLVQITFLGASIAFKSGLHPSIRTFMERLSLRSQRRAHLATLIIALAFFLTLTWYGAHFALFISKQVTPSLGISKAIPVAIIPLASVFASLHALTAICVFFSKKNLQYQHTIEDTNILGTSENQTNLHYPPLTQQPSIEQKQAQKDQPKHGGQS